MPPRGRPQAELRPCHTLRRPKGGFKGVRARLSLDSSGLGRGRKRPRQAGGRSRPPDLTQNPRHTRTARHSGHPGGADCERVDYCASWRPQRSTALPPVMSRLCSLRLAVTTAGVAVAGVTLLAFQVPSPSAHGRHTHADEDDGKETEDQDVEHGPLDHGRGVLTSGTTGPTRPSPIGSPQITGRGLGHGNR